MDRNLEQESMHGFTLSALSQYIHDNIIVSLSMCVQVFKGACDCNVER